MEILDNELVQKYFGCQKYGIQVHTELCWKLVPAFDVLRAMQEPIRKGERYLYWTSKGLFELIATADIDFSGGIYMRLPDRFQTAGKKTCDCDCHDFNKPHPCTCDQPSPALETCGECGKVK